MLTVPVWTTTHITYCGSLDLRNTFFLIIIFLNIIIAINICHFHTCFKMGIM